MGDDEEVGCKVEYLDTIDGTPEETNWIVRAGRARVTYPNGCVFEGIRILFILFYYTLYLLLYLYLIVLNLGTFDAERIKQGQGLFIWMKPGEDDEGPSERARYEGNYKDGIRSGFGKMTFPSGDIYEGEWLDNKVLFTY